MATCPSCGNRWDEPHETFWVRRPYEQGMPHRCPVCQGKGTLPPGFYEHGDSVTRSDTTPDPCKTCDGLGYIR